MPGCNWAPDHEEVAASLHVVLALMSTGPVGISDLVGFTNATLVNRTVASSGLLLKPSKAVTTIDSIIGGSDQSFHEPGHVFGTFSGPASAPPSERDSLLAHAPTPWAWHFASFLLTRGRRVPRSDLWPPAPPNTTSFFHRSFSPTPPDVACPNGTRADAAAGCVKVVTAEHDGDIVFTAPSSDHSNVSLGTDLVPNVETVWPIGVAACSHSSGWFVCNVSFFASRMLSVGLR